jgi:hypothetical protein
MQIGSLLFNVSSEQLQGKLQTRGSVNTDNYIVSKEHAVNGNLQENTGALVQTC